MLNHRLAALLVLMTFVVPPLLYHWLTTPGLGWMRPYLIWALAIAASWLWQRRRSTP